MASWPGAGARARADCYHATGSSAIARSRALTAGLWMAASIASFVAMAVAVRQLSGRVPTVEIMFFRSLVGLAILAPVVLGHGIRQVASRRPALQVGRNVIHFAGQYTWVWGIALAPLATVTAIEFTTPIWVTLIAAALLGERLASHRWIALGAGFVGVLLIVRPGAGAGPLASAVLLAGAMCFAGSILIVKALTRVDSPLTIVVHMGLVQLPIGLVPSLVVWVWPAWTDGAYLVVVGVTALTAHYSLARALALGDASFVMPLDFLRLPCVAAVGLALYGERVDAWTILGAAVIFAGNYWTVWQETRRARPVTGPLAAP